MWFIINNKCNFFVENVLLLLVIISYYLYTSIVFINILTSIILTFSLKFYLV